MKKILSLLMVVALMSCTLFTSCAKKEATNQTQAQAPVETPAAETPAPETPAAETPAAEKKVTTLVYAEVNPLDTIVGKTGTKLKDELERLSNGTMTLDIQASGVLGDETKVLNTMMGGGGTIDMSRISAFALTNYGGEKSTLLSIPYTFVSREHFWNFANSDLAKEILEEPAQKGTGIKGLFYGEEGFRHFFVSNKKNVKGIEDLKGLKIRVSNDPIMNGMVEGLGANPVVVAFTELYSALQSGVCDAAEQPIANYKSNAFPEVANTLILDGHTLGAIQVVITDEAWNKLTPEQQGWLVEAGKNASEYNREMSQQAEDEVLNQLKSENCNVIEVADKTPWLNACKKVIDDASAKNKELYDKIVAMK